MQLLLRNKVFAYLSLSRLFNTLGASIYNLVFIVFASSMPLPKLAIAIANFIVLVPTFMTIFVGIKADRTEQKSRWIIHIGYTQALLFVFVALLTQSSTYLAFSTVCLINILSDILTDFRSGLTMPIVQHNVAQDDLMEAYSFNQAMAYLASIAGQALGVWLLAISQNNFMLVALVNALTFLLSSSTLFMVRKQLTHAPIDQTATHNSLIAQLKEMYQSAKLIFEQDASSNFLRLLGQILILNGLFSSLTAIYNLYLLDHSFYGLSFSQSLFLIDVIVVGGVITSSLFPHDYFAKLSITKLASLVALSCIFLGASNALNLPALVPLLVIAFVGYIIGKINPMVNAMIMSKLKPEVLAQTSSFLSMLFSLAAPLGTMLFTSLALWNMSIAWIIFACFGVLSLLMGMTK